MMWNVCGGVEPAALILKLLFPNLHLQWVQHVLEKTGVPDWYSHATMTPYTNVTTYVNFRGATGCSFQ
eukprot:8977781-Pyramimonas_sp.AAC.1